MSFELKLVPKFKPGEDQDINNPSYKIHVTDDITLICYGKPPGFFHRIFFRLAFGFKFIIMRRF